MKKYGVALLCMLVATILVACGSNKLGKKRIKEILPQEILQYTVEGQVYNSTVKKVDIVRQKTDMQGSTVDCVVTLDGPKVERTEYLTLTCSYWENGGWMLDKWETYQAEEYAPKERLTEEELLNYLVSCGFSANGLDVFDFSTEKKYDFRFYEEYGGNREEAQTALEKHFETQLSNDDKKTWQLFEVNEEHENVTVAGAILETATFRATEGYPREYAWEFDIDARDLCYAWNIFGEWTGDITEDSLSVSLKINSMDVYVNYQDAGEIAHFKNGNSGAFLAWIGDNSDPSREGYGTHLANALGGDGWITCEVYEGTWAGKKTDRLDDIIWIKGTKGTDFSDLQLTAEVGCYDFWNGASSATILFHFFKDKAECSIVYSWFKGIGTTYSESCPVPLLRVK